MHATYLKEGEEIKEAILESGIKVKPVYTQEDIKHLDYNTDLGNPGVYPYTRGIHPDMFRKRPWTIRQYAGFGTPAESNERFKFLIANGQTGLNVAFDLPTQMGLDSDDPLAEGEVGRVGMAVDTLRDFEIAFKDIQLDRIGTSLTINAVASVALAMYQVVAEKYGFPLDKISATPQNDILKEIVGRGTWIFPVEPSIRLIGDTIEYSSKVLPRTYPVSVSGYHIRESGANPVQEIAYALEIAITYVNHVLERGLDCDDFVSRISFNLDIYGNFFEQIAKFRAVRRLWARIVKERFGAKSPRSMQFRMLAGGGGSGLTKQQPENNIVRGAYYAMISALSGTQTQGLCSYDEAYTIPSEKAALISLMTNHILMEEMGLRDTADPLGGSYYVESLTSQIEELVKAEMQKVEDMGGMAYAVDTGYVQREVARQAYQQEKALQEGTIIKVGVNKFVVEEDEPNIELHQYQPEVTAEQINRTKEIKRERDSRTVVQTLKDVESAAKSKRNVMPYLVEAVKAYATMGEMTAVFKDVYGEFKEPSIF
ncbi:MAG: methylmalonyl-CoA mutase family protein [Firmicutes bacterium]|nr:methylmalonyl-CoA mutase family protein [Bacillota bacterium]